MQGLDFYYRYRHIMKLMFAADSGSERATSIEDYQKTCVDFVTDISRDYKDWVDRYGLGSEETRNRKTAIENVVRFTSAWIYRYGTTIKKVDIIMNDGVSKMAENTAGYPFKFNIQVLDQSRYIKHTPGRIKLNIRAVPNEGRLARIGNYQKDKTILINSSSAAGYKLSQESKNPGDILDDYIILDAQQCSKSDVISITVVVEEVDGDHITESRGYTSLIVLV